MRQILFSVCLAVVCCSMAFAQGQIDKDFYYKVTQMPDMTQSGWDILATEPIVLADDWICPDGNPITDIHWWGSYIGWQEDMRDPDLNLVQHPDVFKLSQHLDIPVGSVGANNYSYPGVQIDGDTAVFGSYSVQYYGTVDHGGVFEHVFEYTYILPDYWYQQEGVIYWLDISAMFQEQTDYLWGWHTSDTANIDIAVVDDGSGAGWVPIDPTGERHDLAFQISSVPEPGAMLLFMFGAVWYWFKRKV